MICPLFVPTIISIGRKKLILPLQVSELITKLWKVIAVMIDLILFVCFKPPVPNTSIREFKLSSFSGLMHV